MFHCFSQTMYICISSFVLCLLFCFLALFSFLGSFHMHFFLVSLPHSLTFPLSPSLCQTMYICVFDLGLFALSLKPFVFHSRSLTHFLPHSLIRHAINARSLAHPNRSYSAFFSLSSHFSCVLFLPSSQLFVRSPPFPHHYRHPSQPLITHAKPHPSCVSLSLYFFVYLFPHPSHFLLSFSFSFSYSIHILLVLSSSASPSRHPLAKSSLSLPLSLPSLRYSPSVPD